jgi:nitrite reductase/ring-hydroxylating ferredoxin subunit
LNRREFLAKTALAAAALAAIEGCGDGQIGAPPVALGQGVTIDLAQFPALASTGVLVDIGHERAAMRTGASTFLGLSRVCTHQQCEAFVRNNRIECDCHGSIFSNTGDVIRGPSTGESIRPLDKLSVQFNAAANTLTVS